MHFPKEKGKKDQWAPSRSKARGEALKKGACRRGEKKKKRASSNKKVKKEGKHRRNIPPKGGYFFLQYGKGGEPFIHEGGELFNRWKKWGSVLHLNSEGEKRKKREGYMNLGRKRR